MTWTGPHEVIGAVNAFAFETRPLGAKAGTRPLIAHIVRIRRFSNAALGTEADRQALLDAARRDFPQNFVKSIVGHRVDQAHGVFTLKVRWLGWGPQEDTYEPIHTLAADAPHFVEDYLSQHREDETCARYLQEYFP